MEANSEKKLTLIAGAIGSILVILGYATKEEAETIVKGIELINDGANLIAASVIGYSISRGLKKLGEKRNKD